MIQSLSDKLLSILSPLQWVWQPFVSVKDYHTLENDGYPFLTFEPVSFEASVLDTCNNNRTYRFQILIFQEIDGRWWRKAAKEIISKSINTVIDIIDENYTLDNTVTRVAPVSWNITPFSISNWDALVADITVDIQTIEYIK